MRLASSALLRRAATMSSSSYSRRGHPRPGPGRGYSDRPSRPSYGAGAEPVSGDSHIGAVRAANDSLRRGGFRAPPAPYRQQGPHPHHHHPAYGYGYGYGYGQPQQPRPVYGFVPYDYSRLQPPPPPPGPQYGYGVPNPYGHGHLHPHGRPPGSAGFRPVVAPLTPRLPDYRRRWRFARQCPPQQAERFEVLSYNILADYLAHEHKFLYEQIPPFILGWKWRKQRLAFEFSLWSPDILCLQEVDKFADLEQELANQGYSGIWKMRTGNAADGCAIFWRTARFQLRYEENIEFNKLGLRDNVAQLCVLESVVPRNVQTDSTHIFTSPSHPQTAKQVVVCNIHVLYNPKRGDIKLGQVRTLLDRAYTVSKMWNDAPVILCGDFNSTPRSPLYNFLLEQKLNLSGLSKSTISGQLTSASSQGLYTGPNIPRSHSPFYPTNNREGNRTLQNGCQAQTVIIKSMDNAIPARIEPVLSGTSESRFDTESVKSHGNGITCSGSTNLEEQRLSCLEGPGKDSCTSDMDAHANQTDGDEGSAIEKFSEGCFGGIKTGSGEGPDVSGVSSAPATVCVEVLQSSSNEIVDSSSLLPSDESTMPKDSIKESAESSKKAPDAHGVLPGDVISEEFTCVESGVQSAELLAVSRDNPDKKEKSIGSMLPGQENCKTNELLLSHFDGSQNFSDTLHRMSNVSLEAESSTGGIHLTSTAEAIDQPNPAVSDSCDNQCTPQVINMHSVSCTDESENNAHAFEDGTTANEILCTDVNSDPSFFQELSGGNDGLLEEEDQLPATSDVSPSSQQWVISNERYRQFDRYRWTLEEIKAATGKDDCTFVEHNLKLRSVYTDVEDFEGTKDANKEPLVTSYNRKFMGTVDYIWASEGLQTVKVLDTFPKEILTETIGFPTKKWGSDHIALVCELAFTK